MESDDCLDVKIIPGASRGGIVGWLGDRLKVKVTSPPEGGKANAELVKLLAEALEIPHQKISIASGTSSPLKRVKFQDLCKDKLLIRIAQLNISKKNQSAK